MMSTEAYCATIGRFYNRSRHIASVQSVFFYQMQKVSKGTPKTCDFIVNISFIVTSDPEIKKLLYEYISG